MTDGNQRRPRNSHEAMRQSQARIRNGEKATRADLPALLAEKVAAEMLAGATPQPMTKSALQPSKRTEKQRALSKRDKLFEAYQAAQHHVDELGGDDDDYSDWSDSVDAYDDDAVIEPLPDEQIAGAQAAYDAAHHSTAAEQAAMEIVSGAARLIDRGDV